ncbi:hypothetical protein ACLOJK_011894 [Asimina triloba]
MQLIVAIYIVLSKVILVQGISSTVFLLYQFILATLVLGASALIFERVTLTQNLLSASLYYISSTLQASVLNMVPIVTYLLSIIVREEQLEIRTIWGKGKLLGTLVSVSGALTLISWRGSAVAVLLLPASSEQWMLGFAMVVGAVLSLSTWILLLNSFEMIRPTFMRITTNTKP